MRKLISLAFESASKGIDMTKRLKTGLIMTALGVALTGGSVFYAFAATSAESAKGMMMHGDHAGMPLMHMMGQMSEMMEACSKMMSTMAKPNRSQESKQKNEPEKNT